MSLTTQAQAQQAHAYTTRPASQTKACKPIPREMPDLNRLLVHTLYVHNRDPRSPMQKQGGELPVKGGGLEGGWVSWVTVSGIPVSSADNYM
jgi:hypothetical protein